LPNMRSDDSSGSQTESVVTSPDESFTRSRDEALLRLLIAATATFDSDRDRAKTFVQQATELVRLSLERAGYLQSESFTRRRLAPWQERRLASCIDSNISLKFRIADLAGIVQLSLGHFTRAFRGSFGQTPLAYVNERRIRRAQVIMRNTREPLSKVALDCGLSDQPHFTRLFRKVVGVNPNVWRRQFQPRSVTHCENLRQQSHADP
jgi:AraC family transcriptional regulator